MTVRQVSLAALVVFALAVPEAARAQENTDQMLGRAVAMQQAGDLLGAVQLYQVVLQSSPHLARPQNRGQAALERNAGPIRGFGPESVDR